MKWVIRILIFFGLVELVAGAAGVQRYSLSGGITSITLYTALERTLALLVGIISLGAAYGCIKRRLFGWSLVTILLASLLLYHISWSLYAIFALRIPLIEYYWLLILVALWTWLLFVFWPPQRRRFMPNQSPDPTTTPVKPAAGQPTRQP